MTTNDSTPLPAETLRQRLDYCPETGVFTHRITTATSAVGTRAGYVSKQGYEIISVQGKEYKAHRLAFLHMTGEFPAKGLQVDHINGIRHDNRFCNLRVVNPAENSQNQAVAHKGTKTGLIGVTWFKPSQKYHAQIRMNGETYHLGLFDTAEEAHRVYLSAKSEMHPGSVRLEKPESAVPYRKPGDLRSDNKTGFVGVFRKKSGRYWAYVKHEKKTWNLGTYQDKQSAIDARASAVSRIAAGLPPK